MGWLFKKSPDWPEFPERVDANGVRYRNQYDIDRWKVQLRKIASEFLPSFSFGRCGCCGMPWWVVEGHTVSYSEGGGCFPVCHSCWNDLNPEEVWPFYQAFIKENYPNYPQYEAQLKENLYKGKVFTSFKIENVNDLK